MIGNLTQPQIDRLLHKEVVGRIGCHSADMVYIVPISYAYDGKCIYAHTFEGMKIDMMRKDPEVCFQVDDFRDMANWRSAIAWGKFEEITNEADRSKAIKLLLDRRLPVVSSITTHLGSSWPFYTDTAEHIEGIIFRIIISKRTGKFEKLPPPAYD